MLLMLCKNIKSVELAFINPELRKSAHSLKQNMMMGLAVESEVYRKISLIFDGLKKICRTSHTTSLCQSLLV